MPVIGASFSLLELPQTFATKEIMTSGELNANYQKET